MRYIMMSVCSEANPRASGQCLWFQKYAINMAQIATNLMVASLIDEERKIDLTKLRGRISHTME